jgi:APA family basic amino acid/polyamine antiporter
VTELLRTLRLRDLLLLVIGSVIGSGIFLVPAGILNQVDHSVLAAALVWVFGGILSLMGALTYAELAVTTPAAGGVYVYIRDAFGPLPAFLYGWSLFLAIASGEVSALAIAFSAYLGGIIPLSTLQAKIVASAMIAVVTAVNVWGTRKSSDLQNWTTLIKALLIVGISAVLLALGRGYSGIPASLWPSSASGSLFSKFGLAMITVFWAYEGWQFVTYSAGEAVNPKRDFPRAMFSGMVFLIGVYLLANLGYLAALGPEKVGRSETIAAASISAVLGPGAAKIVALTILISVFSATNSVVLTAPRVFYAMANDGLFFRRLADVHPRFRTPATAVIVLGIWSIFLAWLGKFQELIGYAMFVAWIFYGLAAAAVFVYRRKYPQVEMSYRVPGYPWTPMLFVLAAAVLVINAIVSAGANAMIGLSVVAVGLPVYFLWRRRRVPKAPEYSRVP